MNWKGFTLPTYPLPGMWGTWAIKVAHALNSCASTACEIPINYIQSAFNIDPVTRQIDPSPYQCRGGITAGFENNSKAVGWIRTIDGNLTKKLLEMHGIQYTIMVKITFSDMANSNYCGAQ